MITSPPLSASIGPQTSTPPPPPGNPDFTYWFNGQPLVGQVSGNDLEFWFDGQPEIQVGA